MCMYSGGWTSRSSHAPELSPSGAHSMNLRLRVVFCERRSHESRECAVLRLKS